MNADQLSTGDMFESFLCHRCKLALCGKVLAAALRTNFRASWPEHRDGTVPSAKLKFLTMSPCFGRSHSLFQRVVSSSLATLCLVAEVSLSFSLFSPSLLSLSLSLLYSLLVN